MGGLKHTMSHLWQLMSHSFEGLLIVPVIYLWQRVLSDDSRVGQLLIIAVSYLYAPTCTIGWRPQVHGSKYSSQMLVTTRVFGPIPLISIRVLQHLPLLGEVSLNHPICDLLNVYFTATVDSIASTRRSPWVVPSAASDSFRTYGC